MLLSSAQGHHVSGEVIHIISNIGLTFVMVIFPADVIKCLEEWVPFSNSHRGTKWASNGPEEKSTVLEAIVYHK